MPDDTCWQPRRLLLIEEEVRRDAGGELAHPLRRLAVVALIRNPCSGRYCEDLSPLFALGAVAGAELTARGRAVLGDAVIEGYGKAVLVGLGGELEHAAAILHVGFVPSLRRLLPSRSLMPATKRVAPAGAEITVPLGHLHDAWSPQHWDALHLTIPDGPRRDELAIVLALATGGRPGFRVGDHRPAGA